MEKIFIQNRKDKKISVIVEKAENQNGLVFVMHGLGGFKEQPHIQTMAEAFFDNGYTVIRFDSTNTFGESDGNYEDATVTNYYEDLEDVIAWASKQECYQEPFVLAGHSLGGICTALFSEKFPERIKALALISTVVSGKLSMQVPGFEDYYNNWQKTGWSEKSSVSKPGIVKRLKWSHMEDRLKYDLLPNIGMLKMPVLLVVGSQDEVTPYEHQKIFFDALPGDKKEIHIISGSSHTFREHQHLAVLKKLFHEWIKKI